MNLKLTNDSPIGKAVLHFFTLCGLNIVWLLCCLPVITAGPAITALHAAIGALEDEDDLPVFRTFFLTFRQKWKQTGLLWLVVLVLAVCGALGLRILSFWEGTARTIGIAVFCIPLMVAAMTAAYMFPILARFEEKTIPLLSDSLLIALAYFPKTLLILFLNALPFFILVFFPSFIAAALFVWVPIGFAFSALLIWRIQKPIFESLEER